MQPSVVLPQCPVRLGQRLALQSHRGESLLGVLQLLLQLLDLLLERMLPRHTAANLFDGELNVLTRCFGELPTAFSQ